MAEQKYNDARKDTRQSKAKRNEDMKAHNERMQFELRRVGALDEWKEQKIELIDKIPDESTYKVHWKQTIMADDIKKKADLSACDDALLLGSIKKSVNNSPEPKKMDPVDEFRMKRAAEL
jgi:hypothetical protein